MSKTTSTAWRAVVYTEGRTPCGTSSEGIPEVLPGLYATAQQAKAAAMAALVCRPELYSCAARRVEAPTD